MVRKLKVVTLTLSLGDALAAGEPWDTKLAESWMGDLI
jgi:hypothetical protein